MTTSDTALKSKLDTGFVSLSDFVVAADVLGDLLSAGTASLAEVLDCCLDHVDILGMSGSSCLLLGGGLLLSRSIRHGCKITSNRITLLEIAFTDVTMVTVLNAKIYSIDRRTS